MRNYYLLFILTLFTSYQLFSQTSLFITDSGTIRGMEIIGDDLYFCNFSGKISKVDITTTNPSIIDVFNGVSGPVAIELNGNELYISEYYGNKISKIDITETNPTLIDVVTGLNKPGDILINGNELYFCETVEGKISKINISLANPNIEEVINGLSYPSSIALYGNELYISEESANKISKINITDTNPSISNVITGFNARGILISGNNLFVSGNNEVSKIDITQTSSQLTSVASGFCCVAGDIELNGNDLYTSMLQSGDIYKSNLSSLSVESFENISFKVFPNPSLDFIQVKNLDKEQNYVIYNNRGSQIFAGKILNNNTIDIKHLKNGLYFLRFENGYTMKFLKK